MIRPIAGSFVALLLVVGCAKSDDPSDESPLQESSEDTAMVKEPPTEDTTVADTSVNRPDEDSADEKTNDKADKDISFSWDGPALAFFRDSTVMPLGIKTGGSRRELGIQDEIIDSVRYAVYPESSSRKIFVVDSLENRTRVVRRGRDTTYQYVVGRGHFLDSMATGPTAPRIRVGSHGPLAFRVPADVEEYRDRVPARDTTLTAGQQQAVGEYVAEQLIDRERGYGFGPRDSTKMNAGPSERRVLKRTAIAQLDPAVEAVDSIDTAVGDTLSLSVDVAALDIEGQEAPRHLIVATRVDADLIDVRREGEGPQGYMKYRAGTATPVRITSDSAQTALGLDADSVKSAFYQEISQTAVFIGRLSADSWEETGAKVNTNRHRESLQVLDANGDGMPEFLFESGAIDGVGYRLFAYRDSTFTRL